MAKHNARDHLSHRDFVATQPIDNFNVDITAHGPAIGTEQSALVKRIVDNFSEGKSLGHYMRFMKKPRRICTS